MFRRLLPCTFALVLAVTLAACSSGDEGASESNGEEVPGEVSTTRPGDTVSVPDTSAPPQSQTDNLSDNAICAAATSPALTDVGNPQFNNAVSTFRVVIQTYEANMTSEGLAALQPFKDATTPDAQANAIGEFNDWCSGEG